MLKPARAVPVHGVHSLQSLRHIATQVQQREASSRARTQPIFGRKARRAVLKQRLKGDVRTISGHSASSSHRLLPVDEGNSTFPTECLFWTRDFLQCPRNALCLFLATFCQPAKTLLRPLAEQAKLASSCLALNPHVVAQILLVPMPRCALPGHVERSAPSWIPLASHLQLCFALRLMQETLLM